MSYMSGSGCEVVRLAEARCSPNLSSTKMSSHGVCKSETLSSIEQPVSLLITIVKALVRHCASASMSRSRHSSVRLFITFNYFELSSTGTGSIFANVVALASLGVVNRESRRALHLNRHRFVILFRFQSLEDARGDL